jgi:predicted dehydrogenase
MIKLGMIGTGDMGQVHIRALNALEKEARLTAIYEPNPERAKAALHLCSHSVTVCRTRQELLEQEDIKGIFITSPNDCHYDDVLAVIESGKNIFCEKPLATTMEDTIGIVQAVQRAGRILQVGLVYRYSLLFRRMAQIIQEGCIGEPRMVWCHEFRVPFPVGRDREWRYSQSRSGGTLVEKNCHHFDLFNWMMGTDPIRVFASGGLDVVKTDGPFPPGVPGEPYRYCGPTDVIDNAWVIVDFDNGARANLGLCMFADHRDLPFGVMGTRGWVEGSVDAQKLVCCTYADNRRWEECFQERILGKNAYMGHPGGQSQVSEFIRCLQDKREPFCNGQVALKSMAVGFAAQTSLKRGNYVYLEECMDHLDYPAVHRE